MIKTTVISLNFFANYIILKLFELFSLLLLISCFEGGNPVLQSWKPVLKQVLFYVQYNACWFECVGVRDEAGIKLD